jgi:xanthine dehydrogenase accessory factor
MAPVTIALGPGFNAGVDVDVVIETMRGHNLGRLIFSGFALKNTGVPGEIGGYASERVIYSPCDGIIINIKKIGDIVEAGESIAKIGDNEVKAEISGLLRGIIRDGYKVFKGLKIGDVDPRINEIENYNSISDKARCIGGGVLEAVLLMKARLKKNEA